MYGSGSMVFSPFVEIFRSADGTLFGPPRQTAVITAPAIDLRGPAGEMDKKEISRRRIQRIRRILALAAAKGIRTLTLGAWGCGVFRNPSDQVASDFTGYWWRKGIAFISTPSSLPYTALETRGISRPFGKGFPHRLQPMAAGSLPPSVRDSLFLMKCLKKNSISPFRRQQRHFYHFLL